MNRQIKAQWIEALRSGEYKQDRDGGQLKTDKGFCCLGVLADLYLKDKGEQWDKTESEYKVDGCNQFLPETVKNWAEMDQGNPWLKYVDEEGYTHCDNAITDLNDSGVPFDVLADLIEEQVPVTV